MTTAQYDDVAVAEDTEKGRYLIFTLGKESFGISIRHITEIIGVYPITRLPHVPDYVMGIINLRSKIIPVIDMRLRFHMPLAEYNERTCILIVDYAGMTVGLIVDSVAEVATIDDNNIVAPPDGDYTVHQAYLSGIGMVAGEVKLLLECGRILDDSEAIDE